mgnify:CR=1 FL=1
MSHTAIRHFENSRKTGVDSVRVQNSFPESPEPAIHVSECFPTFLTVTVPEELRTGTPQSRRSFILERIAEADADRRSGNTNRYWVHDGVDTIYSEHDFTTPESQKEISYTIVSVGDLDLKDGCTL